MYQRLNLDHDKCFWKQIAEQTIDTAGQALRAASHSQHSQYDVEYKFVTAMTSHLLETSNIPPNAILEAVKYALTQVEEK